VLARLDDRSVMGRFQVDFLVVVTFSVASSLCCNGGRNVLFHYNINSF
jgi:hypothetical protein